MVDGMDVDNNYTPDNSNGVSTTQTIFAKPFLDVLIIEVFTSQNFQHFKNLCLLCYICMELFFLLRLPNLIPVAYKTN